MGKSYQVKFRRDLNNARLRELLDHAWRGRPYASLTARLRVREAASEAEKRRYRLVSPFFWCGRRDLNPYSVNYTPLKRARLPVPPLPHIKHLYFITRRRSPRFFLTSLPRTYDIIHYEMRFVNTFLKNIFNFFLFYFWMEITILKNT